MKYCLLYLFTTTSYLILSQGVSCADHIKYQNLKSSIFFYQNLDAGIDIKDLKVIDNDTIVLYEVMEFIYTPLPEFKYSIRITSTKNKAVYSFAEYDDICESNDTENPKITFGKIDLENKSFEILCNNNHWRYLILE